MRLDELGYSHQQDVKCGASNPRDDVPEGNITPRDLLNRRDRRENDRRKMVECKGHRQFEKDHLELRGK